MKSLIILTALTLLHSCASGVPYDKIQTIRYNDYVKTVFKKLGKEDAELCALDSMDSKFLVYLCPVSGGPNTRIYISTKTYRVRGIKRDWEQYKAEQAAWAKAIGAIGKSVRETIEKNQSYGQPNTNQPVIYQNPFGHMKAPAPYEPKPVGGANDLFEY